MTNESGHALKTRVILAAGLLQVAAQACAAPPIMPSDAAIEQAIARQKALGSQDLDQAQSQAQFLARHPQQFPNPDRFPKAVVAPPDPDQIAQEYQKLQAQPGIGVPRYDLLVFVSFSMPKASLDRLAQQASQAGAALVFRGFKNNSIKDTVTAFQPLAKRGAGALIDPPAFEHYKIHAVPEFMLAQGKPGCQGDGCYSHVLTVEGDVSLGYALTRMASAHDPLSGEAQARLARLGGDR